MQADDVERLRQAAVTDPRAARAIVLRLLESADCEASLERLSSPGDGRVRQVVAMVHRLNAAHRARLDPWLRRWFEVETDEFTRSAIARALRPDEHSAGATSRTVAGAGTANAIGAYRYVSDRLCHRIRNALALPSTQLRRLEELAIAADEETRMALLEVHRAIKAGLTRIARNVEFDVGDDYLTWKELELVPWLEKSASIFAARFGNARLQVACDARVRGVRIRGTEFLLETMFGNVWTNAIQAADAADTLLLEMAFDARAHRVSIVAIDQGPGFAEEHLDAAFQQSFSTKGSGRGRGLLEIADAVAQMQGVVTLRPDATGKYRLEIALPTVHE